MTNDAAFFEAFVNVPHTVLGKRLQPLSLFHLIWLYQIASPLVLTSKQARIDDLEIAVIVCSSTTNEQVLRGLNRKEQTLRQKTSSFFWRWTNRRKRDLETELQRFIAYNDDYIALPTFFPKSDNEETNESLPWLLLHAASLIKSTGWTESQVFTMPVGKILWYNLALGFLTTGKTTVMSDKEQVAVAALRELTAKGR